MGRISLRLNQSGDFQSIDYYLNILARSTALARNVRHRLWFRSPERLKNPANPA